MEYVEKIRVKRVRRIRVVVDGRVERMKSARDRLAEKHPVMSQKAKREPLKAIRLKCLECSNDNPGEVARCALEDACSLFPFRFGVRPSTRERRQAKKNRAK